MVVRLVNLQACVAETERSLSEIVSEVDKVLEGDSGAILVSLSISFFSF
jgi:hypothetical protein